MKNQREICQALLDGKTLRNKGGNTVSLEEGNLVDIRGRLRQDWFSMPEDWEVVPESLVVWRRAVRYPGGLWDTNICWHPSKEAFMKVYTGAGYKYGKWESINEPEVCDEQNS